MNDASVSFDEYWARYVRFHADPRLRRLQFAATSLGLGVAVSGVLTRRLSLLGAATSFAFVPAIVARALWGRDTSPIEGHPLYRIVAAVRAWHLTLVGTMQAEVERASAAAGVSGAGDVPSHGDEFPRPNMVTDHTLH